MRDKKSKERKEAVRLFSLVTNITVTTAACVSVGILLGYFLDRWLGTSPWLLIILTVLGVAAAFKNIHDISAKM